MTTGLLIARHGNTFGPGDTPLRGGAGTDLPLVESGLQQGSMLGLYFRENNIKLDAVYCSPLKRQRETAERALQSCGQEDLILTIDPRFNEIDYGPDEAKTEEDVIARIGKEAIEAWNKDAIVPDGWNVDPEAFIQNWKNFAESIVLKHKNETILVVTSNGTARFAPHLTGNFDSFCQEHDIKLSTGALGALHYNEFTGNWDTQYWNLKPKKWLEENNIDISTVIPETRQ